MKHICTLKQALQGGVNRLMFSRFSWCDSYFGNWDYNLDGYPNAQEHPTSRPSMIYKRTYISRKIYPAFNSKILPLYILQWTITFNSTI